ncbi:site-2 protease family protein [Candidatus Shapirobacteria bacterium]|nr:site-2 protease family protein [Candidatus Shapirobacteria bacterium]
MYILWIPSLLIALTIHEYAHAKVADLLGDPTPRLAGRLTLNPLAHLDPLGTLALFLFHFGWGKPVPIDPYNLQNPRRDQALISLAGPGSNFTLVLILAILSWVFKLSDYSLIYTFILSLATMNLGLGFFNLLPLGPLDGKKIFLGFLPLNLAQEWEQVLNQYGLIFLLLLFLPLLRGNSLLGLTLGNTVYFIRHLLFPFT